MNITKEEKETLEFVYECIYSDYAKAARSKKDPIKKKRLEVWEKHLKRMQSINEKCGIKVVYSPLNKSAST